MAGLMETTIVQEETVLTHKGINVCLLNNSLKLIARTLCTGALPMLLEFQFLLEMMTFGVKGLQNHDFWKHL